MTGSYVSNSIYSKISQHQKNRLRSLRSLEGNARAEYINALDLFMTVVASMPSKDNPVKYLDWQSRCGKAQLDFFKTFRFYSHAFNERYFYEKSLINEVGL